MTATERNSISMMYQEHQSEPIFCEAIESTMIHLGYELNEQKEFVEIKNNDEKLAQEARIANAISMAKENYTESYYKNGTNVIQYPWARKEKDVKETRAFMALTYLGYNIYLQVFWNLYESNKSIQWNVENYIENYQEVGKKYNNE